jgi:hypothetical protein
MLVSVHRAVSAVLHVMLVAFVTLSARVQHGVLRSKHWFSKHWFAPAGTAVAASAWLWGGTVGAHAWLWGG